MASQAHAFYCFEVLSAAFAETRHADLQEILDVYDQPSTSRTDGDGVGASSDGQQMLTDDDKQSSDHGASPPQLPSISRLQANDSSSQSASSSPLSTSVNSSTSQLTSSTGTGVTNPSTYASRLAVTESYPMFVTWNVLSKSGHKSLRGCIGTFEPLPLEKGLEQYALTSAFNDTRFSPIPASQLPSLSCSLTLLADFEGCAHALDWTLGTHGIRISFTHRSRRHGATYLPDVAVEQGWTKEDTLEHLMRKAGWEPGARRLLRGSTKPWQEVVDFKVVRYAGLKASATYSEWQEWRKSTSFTPVNI